MLSDEHGDTSDEVMNVTDQFIADYAAEAERHRSKDRSELSRPDQMISDAEASKAHVLATPGKQMQDESHPNVRLQSVAVDKNYMVIGTHLDATTKQKIINHEYVDFAQLLPKDRISKEDDHQMELVSRDGHTYFAPIADCENMGITNLAKWEQAF